MFSVLLMLVSVVIIGATTTLSLLLQTQNLACRSKLNVQAIENSLETHPMFNIPSGTANRL